MTGRPLLEVIDLSISFGRGRQSQQRAVDRVGFAVYPGAMTALVGESGSGKSVTALSLLGLLSPTHAHIEPDSRLLWQGCNLLEYSVRQWRSLRGRSIAMIFQDPLSSLNPVLSIGYQLEEVIRVHGKIPRGERRQRARQLLEQVGIDHPDERLNAYPHELSGGQQQRVMIAMAISSGPQLLIADEPTTALDVTVQRQIMLLLKHLQSQLGLAILFITHDLALVGEFADEVVVLRRGRVIEQGRVKKMLQAPEQDYTRALLACRSGLSSGVLRLPVIDEEGRLQAAAQQGIARQERIQGSPVLEVKDITHAYVRRISGWRKMRQVALEPVSFTLMAGKTLGVVGESGSGKSTLARIVAGIQIPDGGTLRYLVPRDPVRHHPVQMVFQNPFASLNPRFTVAQILLEPLQLHHVGSSKSERLEIVQHWLVRVGLPKDSIERYPHEFSGGQRQRIAIARALTLSPSLLICDESVAALDVSVQAQILNLLRDLQDELGMSYLFISHDLSVVRFMADDILVLQSGKVREQGSVEQVMTSPQHVYTRQLLASLPKTSVTH